MAYPPQFLCELGVVKVTVWPNLDLQKKKITQIDENRNQLKISLLKRVISAQKGKLDAYEQIYCLIQKNLRGLLLIYLKENFKR